MTGKPLKWPPNLVQLFIEYFDLALQLKLKLSSIIFRYCPINTGESEYHHD
ncbi:hypothetical protein IYO2065_16370 [Lactiplantibacillus plantarum]|nr:hypothetical protein IYO2065_16370 [Lactiplantibacillus plantarum]BEI64182.1 hypothetical protein IYO1511_c16670 [Lactiplantibacillus plantarum]GIQ93643.1 hypothetical protein COY2906_05130 [Lactiplantibacillus plantarum]